MAYRLFSTDNADYVLQLGNHKSRNEQIDIFEGIDAMVVETGLIRLNDYLNLNHPHFRMPLDFCKDNQIPVYGPDVKPSVRRGFFSETPNLLLNLIPIFYCMSTSSANEHGSKLYSALSFLSQSLITEARNATNARNVEEFVVPRVREIYGKEKPKIGMVYGAGHMGLEYCLKSKRRRNFTIWNYRNFNFRKYSGLDREKLNQVDEANFDGAWKVTEHPTELFP